MIYQRMLQFAIAILLIAMILFGCIPGQAGVATPALTRSPVPPALSTPAVTLTPGAVLPLITLVEYGYQFRYPPEYQAAVFANRVCLGLGQVSGPSELCEGQNLIVEVLGVAGRTLSEWANAAAVNGSERTGLTVGGEEAIRLDRIRGFEGTRVVIVLHENRRYLLTFFGWPEENAESSQQGNLYQTVIDSFAFLPLPADQVQGEFGVSAVLPTTIYKWPAMDAQPVGILEAGSAASVIGSVMKNADTELWLHIICPDGISADCWVLYHRNSTHYAFGPPVPLDIPDPSSLKIMSTTTANSPNFIWQAETIRTEAVSLGGEGDYQAWFSYVRMTVTSGGGRTWTPVSEWRAAALDEPAPPQVFLWSKDGRYLFFTSVWHPEAACASFNNIGFSFERLDLTDGSVAALQPPHAFSILAISHNETWMAYLTEPERPRLVVRELAAAYDAGSLVTRDVPLPPGIVSEIAWSPDDRKVLVTVMVEAGCEFSRILQWELDVTTGEFIEVSNVAAPTPAP